MTSEQIKQRLINLEKLATIYHTDKGEHGYMPFYAEYLPDQCRDLLEIGVAKGGSLRLWNSIFGTDCEIHVLDLFGDPQHVSMRWCRRNEFVPHQGDQSDTTCLYRELDAKIFDVIIDDGSHKSDDQQISFKHLFINNLRQGGLYVIEDIFCCTNKFYWGSVTQYEDTILAAFKEYKKTGKLSNIYFTIGDGCLENIEKIEICANEKIAFVWKKSK